MSAIGQLEPVRGGPLFRPLSAEDEEQQPDEIESLCMSCYRNGVTRLLLTKIPFFKEIIVSSFSCSSCAWSNTEIQSVGRIQEQGVRYTLAVTVRQTDLPMHLSPEPQAFCTRGLAGSAPPYLTRVCTAGICCWTAGESGLHC